MAARKLKITKNAHVMHVNTAINSLNDTLGGENPIVETVKRYLESVELKYNVIISDSEKIQEVLTEEEDITKEIDEMNTLEERVIEIRCRAKTFLEKACKVQDAAAGNGQNETNVLVNTLLNELKESRNRQENEAYRDRTPAHITPKLPELQVEKFNGDLEKYQEFMDSFIATIDQNPKLEAIDKFRYLRMFLEDKREGDGPKSLIEGFSTTGANYVEALTLIKETYGQKERIIISHVSKLLTLEGNPDRGSLRILFNKVKTHVRSLEVLGIDARQYGILLVPIVLSKLTHSMRKEWGKRKQYHDLLKLLDFIEEEILSTEEARQVESAFAPENEHRTSRKSADGQRSGATSEGRSDAYRHPHYTRSNQGPQTATALPVSSQNRRAWCFYCRSNEHGTNKCPKLEKCSNVEVKDFLYAQRLCYCCMKTGHSVEGCYEKSQLKCGLCGAEGKHHTFLHDNEYLSKQSQKAEPEEKEESQVGTKMTTISNLLVPKKVIFHTANAYVTDFETRQKVKVVFDTCSDRSYITAAASSKINLVINKERLDIKGYNGKSDGPKTYTIMHGTIESITRPDQCRSVNLIITDKICPSLRREAVPPAMLDAKYLRGLDMAQDYSSSDMEEIDVLIGLDAYWSFVTGRIKRKKGSPIAVETILGWLLQANPDNTEGTSEQGKQTTSLFMTTTGESEINSEELKEKSGIKYVKGDTEITVSTDEIVESKDTRTSARKKNRKKHIKRNTHCRDINEEKVEEDIPTSQVSPVMNMSANDGTSCRLNPQGFRNIKVLATFNLVFNMLTLILVAILATQIMNPCSQLSGPAEFTSKECVLAPTIHSRSYSRDAAWIKGNPENYYKEDIHTWETVKEDMQSRYTSTRPADSMKNKMKYTLVQKNTIEGRTRCQQTTGYSIINMLKYSPWWGAHRRTENRQKEPFGHGNQQADYKSAPRDEVETLEQHISRLEANSPEGCKRHSCQELVFRQCLNGGECYGFTVVKFENPRKERNSI